MSAKPAEESAPAEKPKSKKMLIIIIAAVVLLALIGGGAAFFLMKKKPADEEGQEETAKAAPKVVHKAPPDPKKPPVYLPMEPMVANLADPGGGRFVQLGITFKLDEAKTGDLVKQFMPSIRSAVLIAVSKRTADELLAPEGKEKLTRTIIRVASEQLGYEVEDEDEEENPAKKKKKRNLPPSPIEDVLYSSFIVQ